MKISPGSYVEKSYFPDPNSLATCLMVGALCVPALAVAGSNFPGYSVGHSGSHFQEKLYQIPTSTWSSVEQVTQSIENVSVTTEINVTESLNVIRNLAFLAVDEDVDSQIEQYFASKPIKTKTIFVNPRLQKR